MKLFSHFPILIILSSVSLSNAFVTTIQYPIFAGQSRQISKQFQKPSSSSSSSIILRTNPNNNDNEKVQVGSKEYLGGFLSSPIQDESVAERGSGLEQALKLGGSVTVVLLALFLGFMAANGLLTV